MRFGRGPADKLPSDFLFGVATADHQCEAYNGNDDVRDVWEHVRGLAPRKRATEFWTRYHEDIGLAARLGCTIFRISLSWARLEPTAGVWDEDVIEHYREVLQAIRSAGMQSVVTLHHNTWPVHVQAAGNGGGMLDSDFPRRLAAYARIVAVRLGDIIDYYLTLNEPNQLIYGYIKPCFMRSYPVPPGLEPLATEQQQTERVLQLIPNLFRAHAAARAAIKSARPQAQVGSNPLVLGLPQWLRTFVDAWAMRVNRPELLRQGRMFSTPRVSARGRVDIEIAQLTMTQSRTADLLFSESYFIAHLSVLHHRSVSLPASFLSWRGRVGVTQGTAAAEQATTVFPKASIISSANADRTIAALRRNEIDIAFDDDVILFAYADADLRFEIIGDSDQPFSVAMTLGARSLLNAVDSALRAFKRRDPMTHRSAWDDAMDKSFAGPHGDPPNLNNRKTLANIGKSAPTLPPASSICGMDGSLDAIRTRGVLRVGIHPGVAGLCAVSQGQYVGLEPTLARYVAAEILGTREPTVEFVVLQTDERLTAPRSRLYFLDTLWKFIATLTTIAAANWWDLGMAGKLPEFLCPPECVGTLDFVGLDYYWGFDRVSTALRLPAAIELRYGSAPVWPGGLYNLIMSEHRRFPDKPIIVIENGCVTQAGSVERAAYLTEHIRQMQSAVADGAPVAAYLCWSITSNREWGLPFNDSSDFGLYHIELDRDPALTRIPTQASERYREIIARRSAW